MKDLLNCPYCQAEEGLTENWGMSPDGWDYLKEIHEEKHKEGK